MKDLDSINFIQDMMIQNFGCQILGIFTTEHLGCDLLLVMLSLLLLEMVKPSRNGQTIFCAAEDDGTDSCWRVLGYLMMKLQEV